MSSLLRSPRQQILLSIIAESQRPISTSELARVTGQSLGATAHHMRALSSDGYLEWAGERRVRGALQTFYIISNLGRQALVARRLDAVLTLFGALDMPSHGSAQASDLDERAQEDLSGLIVEMRPRVLGILKQWVDRTATAPED